MFFTLSCSQCCPRQPHTLVCFPFIRNLYFHLCLCYFYYYYFVLITQDVYRTCQVCVFSQQYSLECSELSQSGDAGLFSSQMNYLLLFNYCLSSICSMLSFWMPFIWIIGFPDLSYSLFIILQDFHHLMFLLFIFHDLSLVSRLIVSSCDCLNCLIGKLSCGHRHMWGCVHTTAPEFPQVLLFFF